MESKQNSVKPSIVFCHGIWADGSCFSKVIPALQAVGHSYGGAVITAAGTDDRVVGLVYIAAVAPDAGETVQSQLDKYPTPILGHIEVADGRVWMLPEGAKDFAGDLPDQEQKIVW